MKYKVGDKVAVITVLGPVDDNHEDLFKKVQMIAHVEKENYANTEFETYMVKGYPYILREEDLRPAKIVEV